jgi:hypothetical protein
MVTVEKFGCFSFFFPNQIGYPKEQFLTIPRKTLEGFPNKKLKSRKLCICFGKKQPVYYY